MASYLEEYGAAEVKHERRIRIVKWAAGLLVLFLVSAFTLYSIFQNYSEEQQVKAFVEHLKNKDYQGAYRMWGCTEATPCRDYNFQRFMEDWGPSSPHANAAVAQIGSGDTCGTGVVVPVDFKGSEQVPLWVERNSKILSFSPDPECRKRRWRLREFFRSLFNKQSFLQLNH